MNAAIFFVSLIVVFASAWATKSLIIWTLRKRKEPLLAPGSRWCIPASSDVRHPIYIEVTGYDGKWVDYVYLDSQRPDRPQVGSKWDCKAEIFFLLYEPLP
jgi:hypothetical protein